MTVHLHVSSRAELRCVLALQSVALQVIKQSLPV